MQRSLIRSPHLVLSKGFIETAVKLVVTRFMPLNPADLESWMIDPEEWVNTEDKESEQWEYEIRVSFICPAHTVLSHGCLSGLQ